MDQQAHAQVLRRAGMVLVAVGAIDIAVMVYCIANGISYSSSLNIFAVVAGVFLIRGSLVAAGLVRWFAVFFLAAMCALLVAWPFMQPIDLTLTQARLSPISTGVSVLLLLAVAVLCLWLQRQLGSPPVIVATRASGKKVRSMRAAAAAGLGLVLLLAVAIPQMLAGESGARAKTVAQERLGAGYRYHVSSLSMSTTSGGTTVSARVTAWNEKEVRVVPVEWNE